jgi:hypothetical protein
MKEHNPETVIRSLKYLLVYYDIHNSLIDAISLLGGDVSNYNYIDPEEEGRN